MFNRISCSCFWDRRVIVLVAVIVIGCLPIVIPRGFFERAGSVHALQNIIWHDAQAAKFPLCSMDNCFNFSRCENAKELLVYSYNDPAPLNPPTYFRGFPGSPWQTSDPDKACLFFVFSDSGANRNAWLKPRPRTLPFWNNGVNHVIVTFADRWSETNPPPESIGMASVLSTELHYTTYRPGFDISIPLPRLQQQSPPQLATVKPLERKYFATFKGTRYLSRAGVFRSSDDFRGMHNGKDIIVATTCRHRTNDKLLRWQPWRGTGCKEDQRVFDSYDFVDLFNSTFGLAPAGRSPASYRLLEVLSAGAIPVLIADDYVLPFDSLIRWDRCLLQFPTDQIHQIIPRLRSLREEELIDRQRYCQAAFASVLRDDTTLLRSVVRSLKQRFEQSSAPNLPPLEAGAHFD